jgi:hypothetical protein
MEKIERPNAVPDEAIWIEDENEWQLGSIMRTGKPPRGACKAWRSNGSLAAEYTLDKSGRVQGTLTRYHPNGEIASRGEWKDGERCGHFLFQQSTNETLEAYPTDPRTWRYEFYAKDNWPLADERWFDKDGMPTTSDGRDLRTAYDMDAVIAIATPESFFANHAANCYEAYYGKAPLPPNYLAEIATFWGLETDAMPALSTSMIDFGVTKPRSFDGNCWEALIANPWGHGNMYQEMSAIFMGAEHLGSVGDCDHFYVTLFNPLRLVSRPNAVYFWTHELYYLEYVVAPDVEHFAFACAVQQAYKAERLSDARVAQAWEKLVGKVQWYGVLDEDNYVRSYHWRSLWLTRLLVADDRRDMAQVKESFIPCSNGNGPLDATRFQELLVIGDVVTPVAVYLLWRLFWPADSRLHEALRRYQTHSARLVIDLVELIGRFENGLPGITGMRDVQAIRSEFMALGLFDTH